MTEAKPKIEGAKKFRQHMRAAGQPTKKEFVTNVLGLESHTFDIGNAKYAAKYKKMVDAIANYIQRESKGGTGITKAIKALSLPTLQGTQRQRPGRPLSIPVMYKSSNRTLPR
jgi:hypothetical protein